MATTSKRDYLAIIRCGMSPTPALLAELRGQACITQTAAATMCRAQLRTWQHWEGGTRAMPLAAMELFGMALALRHIVPADEWMQPWVRPAFCRLIYS